MREALVRYSVRHSSKFIRRKELLDEELNRIIAETGSVGATPWQTLSRVLQELRDSGVLYFLGDGNYVLADEPLIAEDQALPEEALDIAVHHNKLRFGTLPAGDAQAITRRRVGQAKIRNATLHNYHHQCALCDIEDPRLLVAGHILRWADSAEARGDLTNLICMCRFHDALFEEGYFSLADDYHIIKRSRSFSRMIALVLEETGRFRRPTNYPPAASYLNQHRLRTGLA